VQKNDVKSFYIQFHTKRRSQKLKQTCIDEQSEELAGTGAILGESLF